MGLPPAQYKWITLPAVSCWRQRELKCFRSSCGHHFFVSWLKSLKWSGLDTMRAKTLVRRIAYSNNKMKCNRSTKMSYFIWGGSTVLSERTVSELCLVFSILDIPITNSAPAGVYWDWPPCFHQQLPVFMADHDDSPVTESNSERCLFFI